MDFLSVPFMRDGFLASSLAGLSLSFIGLFVVLRRVSFSGLAASQLAALGTVIGLLLPFLGHLGGPFLIVFLGLLLLGLFERRRPHRQESSVAALYIGGAALAVLALAKAPWGESHTLTIFFGNVLSLGAKEIWEGLGLLSITSLTLAFWFHKWVWVGFDPVAAETAGLNRRYWDILFYFIVGLNITIGIHVLGVLLSFSFLILPPAIALCFRVRMTATLGLITALTLGLHFLAFSFSYRWDFPTSAFSAALFAIIFVIVGLFKTTKRI